MTFLFRSDYRIFTFPPVYTNGLSYVLVKFRTKILQALQQIKHQLLRYVDKFMLTFLIRSVYRMFTFPSVHNKGFSYISSILVQFRTKILQILEQIEHQLLIYVDVSHSFRLLDVYASSSAK